MADDRSPTAKAMSIASQITTVAMVLIVPIVVGSWIDSWLGTKPIFVLLGVVSGFVGSGFQLKRLVRSLENQRNSKSE